MILENEELRRAKIVRAAQMIDSMRLFNDYIANELRKRGFEVRTVKIKRPLTSTKEN